jgi:glycosyltransferase involved in cell wall biosynthesis
VGRPVSRPRVLHVVPALFGYEGVYGGAERYALELARAMAGRVPTTLAAFGATPTRSADGPLRIEVVRNWVPYRRFRFDPFGPGLAPLVAKADVVHYHQTHTLMAGFALVLGRLTGRRVVTSHLGGGGTGLHRLTDLTGWYQAHLHISEFSRRAFGHEHLPSARVVLGGVDAEKFRPPAGRPSRGFVLYAGRLLPHKGIDYLLEAVPPDLPVVLAGRPWRHAAGFYARLRGLARGKQVTFAEHCTDDDLRGLYQNALCVVLPSVYRTSAGDEYAIPELLGQTLLEGMACGTPAVCTAVGSMPEVVADGATGFVVPPNDPAALGAKLTWLRDHPAEVEAMGSAARRRAVEVFGWNAVVDRCLAAYEGVSA